MKTQVQTIQALASGRSQTIVAYGCSLTAGGAWVGHLRERLETLYPGMATVINGGKSTECSRWGLQNIDDRVIIHDPDMALLEFSMNDAFEDYSVSFEEARSNLNEMIDRILAKKAACEIILMVMNSIEGKSAGFRPRLEEYNQIYREVARVRGLMLIDHYPAWKKLQTDDHARYLAYVPDGLHPNETGAAAIITPAIFLALGID